MLVIPEKRKLILNSNENARVAQVIPHAKAFTHNGENLLAVPYGVDEAMVLRNLGFSVPAPILQYYSWPARFAAMSHQKDTAAFLTTHKRALVLNAPGTGKSISSLWAADFLLDEGVARKVLIVAPLSTVKVVWGRELKHHLPHRSFVICTGTKEKRLRLLETPGVQYVIINHDGFSNMMQYLSGFDVVIYDEATALKTPGSQRYKLFAKWVQANQPWLWLLTGTPISQTPADAWTLARLVDSPMCPKSYTTFKDMVMQKITTFRWVPRPDALETCRKVLQPSIRFSLDECKDLPDTNFVGRKAEMTQMQLKAFKEMQDKAATVFTAGEVVAANAAVMLSKLLQICCIAAGTPVLARRGWVPIEQITAEDELWDGVEWVNCSGCSFSGYKPVVTCDGVRMTADHRVLTVGGWATAEEILHGDAGGRLAREAVRLPDGYGACSAPARGAQDGAVGVPMRLWGGSGSAESVSAELGPRASAELRMPPRQHGTQYVPHSPIPDMGEHAPQVLGPHEQGLAELRGAGDQGLPSVGGVIREVLGGHGGGVLREADAGARGQLAGIYAGKLPVGDSRRTGEQPADIGMGAHAARAPDRGASCASVQPEADNAVQALGAGGPGPAAPRVEAVYDILNCGPRERFVVQGERGELLVVHNCGVVYDGNGNSIAVDAADRYNTLTELLTEIGDKAIIFVPLKGVQNWLFEKLTADGFDVGMVNGDTGKNERDKLFNDFQHTDKPQILLAHPKVAAHGLTLTRAKDIIWYAPIYSLEQYEQANARIRRLTTTGKTTVWHIYATSFEAELYRRLRAKKNTLAEFLSLVQGINNDD